MSWSSATMIAADKELNEKYRVGKTRQYAVIAAYAANTWGSAQRASC